MRINIIKEVCFLGVVRKEINYKFAFGEQLEVN